MNPNYWRSLPVTALLTALWTFTALPMGSAQPPSSKGDAEDLFRQAKLADASLQNTESLRLLLKAEQYEPKNAEILSFIAREYSQLAADAHATGNRQAEQRLTDCALGYAIRAVNTNPGSAFAHASLAVCYGRSLNLEGTSKKIEYSKLVRSEAEKAVAIDPNQDVALHVLGAWNYGMAQVNPFFKKIVEAIYGHFPDASLKSSAEYFQRAARAAPKRLMHQAALAKTYAALGDKANAHRALAAAESLPVKEKEDAGLLKEARLAVTKMEFSPSASAHGNE